MSFYYFPNEFVYWDRVENHLEIKNELLPLIKEKTKKVKNNPFGNCKFNTSYYRNGDIHDKENSFLMNKKMLDLIMFYLEKMTKKYKNNFNTNNINFKNMAIPSGWWNVYDIDQFQEEHDHVTEPRYINGSLFYSQFSVIYILHDDNDESSIVFRKNGPSPFLPPYNENVFRTNEIKEIKEGTILIFPSNLRHLVKPCIKPGRVTIAYNICMSFQNK